ncbi:MAG: PDZ domain-containing protein [Fermentimonas sp.]
MMKRTLGVALFLFGNLFIVGKIAAQNHAVTCQLGFAFEISESKNWGYKEPVIVDVTPGSPAERAGLKLNDIILSINKNGTYQKSYQTVASWFNQDDTEMTIAIRNFEHSFKEIRIAKDCRHPNAINEAQLAPVFAFYSLEDVQDRRFLMPVITQANEAALFHNYRSFAFSPIDESTRAIDERVNAIFIRSLTAIGLTYNPEDPDFIIQTYYSFESNPMFKVDSSTYGSYHPVWRYDMRNRRTVRVPVYDPSEPVRVDDIAYNLEFGYRFHDRKFMEAGESALIWESEVKERVSGRYTLLDYLELNLPLMLLKFPYPGNPTFASYQVKHIKYNYTGIGYNMDDLRTVVSVDADSPAAAAGILPGDVVVNVQGQNFNHSTRSLTEGYRRFLAETMNLRDRSTRYTDSNGFKECMFWDVSKYRQVSEVLANNRRYSTAFSYLFNFNQYVDWNTPASINIEVERGGNRLNFAVSPRVTESTHILVN